MKREELVKIAETLQREALLMRIYTYEISSYKKDAANLLANRIIKKFRGYFAVLYDFAAFQEVRHSIYINNLLGSASNGKLQFKV